MLTDFYRGDTKVVHLELANPDNSPTNVTGWVFYVSLKLDAVSADGSSASVTKRHPVVGSGASGIVDVVLDASLTATLIAGENYEYDVQAVVPAGWSPLSTEPRVITLARGRVKVLSDVTRSYLPPTIVVTPTTLSPGVVGAAYNQTLTATGGTGPYTWAVTTGSLPAGLTLSSGGLLSGTPTASGYSDFVVTATDSSGVPLTGSRLYAFTVV